MAEKQLVVITGASRGLGRAMVGAFIEEGLTVVGCARSEKALESLRQEFKEPNEFYAVDVGSDTAVKSWASIVLAKQGTPDLLLNNAGVINRNAPLWELDAREFAAVIDTNVTGAVNVIRHFVPAMIQRRKGVIVNFSSGWGRSVDSDVAAYCASKWAVEGLTQAMALELPSTMAAVPLSPGIINTDMLQSCFGSSAGSYPSAAQWVKKAVPYLLKLGPKDNGRPRTVPA